MRLDQTIVPWTSLWLFYFEDWLSEGEWRGGGEHPEPRDVVVQTLERACRNVGYPKMIRVDRGAEFVSRDLDLWAYAKGVTLDFSRPGKPTDSAFIEAFNGR
jgi:transposase InsO family protein